ncbi:heat-inducible transcription repressor HrcA [Corynebacterium kutscheri]|uniref:Heat-inducible transcription repressor HrcA n=1 Tax=Corynebacterium kutscheri TaxID=35755 RepID=A0A0F6TCQ8_9CORY|nr:heat-inducible transcriptional repressor HrcA [Corynebacterium kutscheri]AKE40944.1 heat-inducible transcription repressor HrcA [Corynebacterium kutscheri]VEH09243.1 Heat-inducible transcription repressor hrcA [Corynebacterium kutscheri]
MAGQAEQRRQKVLRAIVADYIASHEPVGSKALLERHQLNVSSATIRNDMVVLESDGYITQQHASSGRIPTQKAYRTFVDSLDEVKPLSQAERSAILSFLEGGVDLEDVLRRSVQLLAQLTRQAAVVQLPNLNVTTVKYCEVVLLSPVRLLLVLITDSGRVEQRNVELTELCEPEQVLKLRDVLNRSLVGKTLTDASVSIAELADIGSVEGHAVDADIRVHVLRCATVLIETLVEQPNDRLILVGASNLTRIARDFPKGLPQVLEALEQQVVMLKLLANVQDLDHVSVLIGEENEEQDLHSASVVAAGYGQPGVTLGGLGVVGPTHMDYSGTISKVAAVAQYVSRVLGS